MTAGDHQKRRKGRALRRFGGDRRGATMIEFALLAFPFTLLVFAILESCISFAAEEYLQNVTDDVARQLRTGQLKSSTLTEAQLKSLICDRLEVFVADGCPGLSIDLRNFDTFDKIAALKHTITSGGDIAIDGGSFKFDPGPSQSKNILRVYYRWPVITDIMRSRMASLKDGKALHFAVATWQNEPFDD